MILIWKGKLYMADRVFDIKWQKDLLSHISAFTSFALEGNVHDLHPLFVDGKYLYLSLEEVIGGLFKDKYCVVFFDHTKKPGKEIKKDDKPAEGDEGDDSVFNSFTFLEKSVINSEGKKIANPNIEIFKRYYYKEYNDRIRASADQSLQGGITLDMQRIFDAMKDYGENNKYVLIMWQNVKGNNLPVWGVIIFAIILAALAGGIIFMVVAKLRTRKIKIARRKAVAAARRN